jgi:3-hydroxybutyrate dehydrogenase
MHMPTHTSSTGPLGGRRALVTGAASGIGAAVATRLAEAGADVHLVDRDEEGVAKVAARVHGTAHVVDLTDQAAIAALDVDVDILVNNAGIQYVAPVEELDPDQFRTIHAVMLHAPFLLARRFLPGMYARGWGRVVHVSSVHGHRASAYKSAYVSAKHGLEGLSKVIALEAAGKGVTSNTVCPGYVRTPLVEGQVTDQARAHGIDESEVLDTVLLARTPVRRLVEPDEVARAVAGFCLPGSDSMTGSSLLIDGGWTAA